MKPCIRLLAFLLFCSSELFTAKAQLNTDAYFKYLEAHKNMKTKDLLNEFPAGVFAPSAPTNLQSAQFFDAINNKYKFTQYEKELAAKNSFMVSERLKNYSYISAYRDIYVKDLPLYISSDAILHGLHRSYDNMLADIEKYSLEPQLIKALISMKNALKTSIPPKDSLALKARNDVDIYLTITLQLLKEDFGGNSSVVIPTEPTFTVNKGEIDKIKKLILELQLVSYPLFAETERDIDFSQMKPRSHYIDKNITGYFKAMMWLGRTEIYITAPQGSLNEQLKTDIKRQCMIAVTLANLAEISGAKENLNSIDGIITKFVGEQDNLSLAKLLTVTSALKLTNPDQLKDDNLQKQFQDEAVKQGAGQRILSQLLYADPSDLNSVKPAASFMLMGQRFIFDSFILGNVVFDKVKDRLMPSPLDAMFVIGNDASAQLLMPELDKYDYAKNLAGLRYLSNSFTKENWESSLYSTWLSAIRTLNPPLNRSKFPRFMQTNAWWEKTLNTQLTSWAELRHDNLLYAKQSYTSGVSGCFYPSGYVEPIPELYTTISKFCSNMSAFVKQIKYEPQYSTADDEQDLSRIGYYLDNISKYSTILASMAEKELRSEPFTTEEQLLIKNWLMVKVTPPDHLGYECGAPSEIVNYNGIYTNFLYGVASDDFEKPNYVIADVHTQPTDSLGNIVGKVLHVATGAMNMAMIIAEDPSDGCSTAYVGPVGSYYEHTEMDFNRLTDEEWGHMYSPGHSPRPKWVNSYLASDSGKTKGEEQTLFLGGIADQKVIPSSLIQGMVTPNPMRDLSTVSFEVPSNLGGKPVTISVYSSQGEYINQLTYSTSGNSKFVAQWDGMDAHGEKVANGVYFVRINIGESSAMLQCTITR